MGGAEIAHKISRKTIAAAAIAGALGYGLSNHQAIQVPPGAGFRSRMSLVDSEPRARAPTQSGPMNVTEFPNECNGSQSLEALAEQLRGSSVLISTDEALGSGIIIASNADRTVILTNRHVVESDDHGPGGAVVLAPGMEVFNDGRSAQVLSVRIAPHDMDLAVVTVQGNLGPPARIYNGSLSRGNSLLVVGSPLGYEDSFSRGILSNFAMRQTPSGYHFRSIQTDAAINPGNSGGGIFLSGTGELVGITSFKLMVNPLVTAEGMGFAIPVHFIYDFPYTIWREIRPAQARDGGSPG